MDINLDKISELSEENFKQQIGQLAGCLRTGQKVRVISKEGERHICETLAAEKLQGQELQSGDLSALITQASALKLSESMQGDLETLSAEIVHLLSKDASEDRVEFQKIPQDVRREVILPQMDIDSLLVLGATNEEDAKMVMQALEQRCPSLLLPDKGLTGVEAVRHATQEWAAQLKRGGEALQRALGGRNPAEVVSLTLKNGSGKPMRLPPKIGNCTQLRELYGSGNQLSSLPSEIGNCTQLQRLYVAVNELSSLPPEIGNCTQLQELSVHENQLSSLPPEIGNCTQLRRLEAEENQLSSLPPKIGNCTQLQRLWVADNQLSSLPPEIGNCTQLQELSVGGNQLSDIPQEIRQIGGLRIEGSP